MNTLIQYRGYYRGDKDIGGTTSLYATEAEALDRAKACCFKGDTAWTMPEFTGSLDTILTALATLDYIEWKPTVRAKTIQPGTTFKAGDIMLADHQITRAAIGLWIVKGKAVLVASSRDRQKAQRIAFVTRKLGKCMPREQAWLEAFELAHGPVAPLQEKETISPGAKETLEGTE